MKRGGTVARGGAGAKQRKQSIGRLLPSRQAGPSTTSIRTAKNSRSRHKDAADPQSVATPPEAEVSSQPISETPPVSLRRRPLRAGSQAIRAASPGAGDEVSTGYTQPPEPLRRGRTRGVTPLGSATPPGAAVVQTSNTSARRAPSQRGRCRTDDHSTRAAQPGTDLDPSTEHGLSPAPLKRRQLTDVSRRRSAAPHLSRATEPVTSIVHKPDIGDVIAEIRETHRQREDLANAERRINNQIKAIHRRLYAGLGQEDRGVEQPEDQGDGHASTVDHVAALVTLPYTEATAPLAAHRKAKEKRLAILAKQLPVWKWIESVRGVGPLGLSQLVGECGDIGSYRGPACLWKRMGLAVINGERQRRVKDKELALKHGYSPRRRAVMYNLGEALVKQNQDGPYRTLYLAVKALERPRVQSDGHAHARARRRMEKAFLVDLWKEWRKAAGIPTEEPVRGVA